MHRFIVAIALALWPLAAWADAGDLIAAVQPAVVNISATTFELTPPQPGNMAGEPRATQKDAQGAGFFVTAAGIIATNRHPIEGASQIIVTLQDGTRLQACVLASTGLSDIALLRVNAGRPMPTLGFGDSDRLRPGDPVFVVGNPLGHGGTVTEGIVSALDRNSSESGFGPFMQIDASVNHGSSGGPVFDTGGAVVGIATALYSPEGETGSVGLGLVIPGNDARLVVERLLAGGRLRLGSIGAQVQAVTADLAAALRLPDAAGAMITAMDGDGPAARAGLAEGDVVLAVGEAAMRGTRALNHAIAASPIGGVVRLTVWREGAARVVPVVIGEAPAEPPAKANPAACTAGRPARPDLGLVVGRLTEDARRKLGLAAGQQGALATDVIANTPAADRGIVAGSLIESVDRKPIATPADVQAAIDAARAAGERLLSVLVRDAQGVRWIALPMEPAPG